MENSVKEFRDKIEPTPSMIKGFPKLIQSFRTLAYNGPLTLRISGETDIEEQDLHFFLFNDIVVYTKRKTSRTFKYKGQFPVRDLILQDSNEANTFSIQYINRVYLLTSQTPELKNLWVAHFERTLELANKHRVFGAPLDVYMKNEDPEYLVPRFIKESVDFLVKNGLDVEGIFRIPCSAADLQSLKEIVNLGLHKGFEKPIDTNLIAGLLRSYLNELPESVPSFPIVDALLSLPRNLETHEMLSQIRSIVQRIPQHHYHMTKTIVLFLKKIADNSAVNKMNPRNLSVIFAPSFLKRRNTIFDCQNWSYELLAFLITYAEKVFGE